MGSSTTITLTGQTGDITGWQTSTNGTTWVDTPGSGGTNVLTTGHLTGTTLFRAVVRSGTCTATNSAPATVTIDVPTVGGSATASPNEVCAGSSTTITLAGETGKITKWQSSTNGTIWSDINATLTSLKTDNLTTTTSFRAVVQNGSCAATNSTEAFVTVAPPTVGGSVTPATNEVCVGLPTTLTLTGQTGTVVNWQSSPDGETWTDIASSEGANPLAVDHVNAETHYRAVVQSGPCVVSNSTPAVVSVKSDCLVLQIEPPDVNQTFVLRWRSTNAVTLQAALFLTNSINIQWTNIFTDTLLTNSFKTNMTGRQQYFRLKVPSAP
jgi:hypothetical protein